MTDASTKASRVEFSRIEVGVLGNCRERLTGINELAQDIGERGLLAPLVVWHKRQKKEPFTLPDGKQVWDRYILIAGNRRHAAIVKIREDDKTAFETVPVTLFTGNEDDALFAQLAENLQREDLTPVDLANAVYRMKQRGHSQAEIAKRISKSQPFVSRLLKLRENAAEPVLRAVAKGDLPMDTALALTDLPEAGQLKALERFEEKKQTEGPKAARADVKQASGKPQRPTVASIRERFATLGNGTPPPAQTPAGIAHGVLSWVLGEGEWPKALGAPPSKEKRS